VAFADYYSRVMGAIPKLDVLAAQSFVQEAWREIRDTKLWSWLYFEGVLVAPQIVVAGSVTTTQFSNKVTLDATAATALKNLQNPLITQRQFRVGIGGGRIYNITNIAGNILTLDGLYMEATGAGQPYQCYRCYYTPADLNGNTITDFLSFDVICNNQDGYAIVGRNLRLTRGEIDARDPTRGAQDLAYTVAQYKPDQFGNPMFELWPHPTAQKAYMCIGRKRGMPLSNTNDIPQTLSGNLVVSKAKDYAYDWAIAHSAEHVELKGVDWELLKAENKRHYTDKMNLARRQDDEIFVQSFLPQLRDYLNYPIIDSDFFQSHDTGGWAE
jgi:hypothetical protein